MSSLFRSIHNNFSNKRENAVKEALLNSLSENAREIQYEVKQCGRDCLELCEATSSLCTTLEAIFLHGLKDSFLWQTINVIAGDVQRRPEPTFWSPLMVFLHKQVIEQIQELPQITSEIGQCRAWIRLSLNDSLFSSYMNNMRRNSSALSPYYKRHALLLDLDNLEMAAKIVGGIEAYAQFDMPVNSSLLNQWPDYSLQLSGLWTPPLKSCPISNGIDVAGSISAEAMDIPTPQPLRTNELFSESISNSPFSRNSNFASNDLNSRENLELFLRKVEEMDIINEEAADAVADDVGDVAKCDGNEESTKPAEAKVTSKKMKSSKKRKLSKDNLSDTEGIIDAVTSAQDLSTLGASRTHGNSLSNLMQTSWSSDQSLAHHRNSDAGSEDQWSSQHRHLQRSLSATSSASSLRSPLNDLPSYNSLLRKHERSRVFDWTEVWEKFNAMSFMPPTTVATAAAAAADADASATDQEDQAQGDDSEQILADSHNNSDFEVVPYVSGAEKFDVSELQEMVEQLCKLAREPGLDAQGFLCKSCQHPLGIGYTNFQVCAFSGNYFCDNCMDTEPILIPARIIYNWDFRKYLVSKRAAAFLAEFRSRPFIDLKMLNPEIYNAAEAMAELQSLRIRLNFIRAYMYTCLASSIEELRRIFFGKEYLYETIHHYSIADLGMILRGTLYQQLQKAYKIGEAHILKCPLCSVKGFICEKCNSPRVLYPFHIDTTYRCETCGAVFHPQCLNEQQPCPKCERKRKREDIEAALPIEAVSKLDSNETSSSSSSAAHQQQESTKEEPHEEIEPKQQN